MLDASWIKGWGTHLHHPLQARIPVLDEFEHPRFVGRLAQLGKDAFGLCDDLGVEGLPDLEEGGEVGGVDVQGDVDGEGGASVGHGESYEVGFRMGEVIERGKGGRTRRDLRRERERER
jgi:hypothetical protein